jgi:predicted thioesterase
MTFSAIVPGLRGEKRLTVENEHTARHWGSGKVDVLATPQMVRMMEEAAVAAVDHLLPEGYHTVGTVVNIRHLAPTPMGMQAVARAEVTAVDGHRVCFQVEAHDGSDKIGDGTHERFIIELDRFRSRVEKKRNQGDEQR